MRDKQIHLIKYFGSLSDMVVAGRNLEQHVDQCMVDLCWREQGNPDETDTYADIDNAIYDAVVWVIDTLVLEQGKEAVNDMVAIYDNYVRTRTNNRFNLTLLQYNLVERLIAETINLRRQIATEWGRVLPELPPSRRWIDQFDLQLTDKGYLELIEHDVVPSTSSGRVAAVTIPRILQSSYRDPDDYDEPTPLGLI